MMAPENSSPASASRVSPENARILYLDEFEIPQVMTPEKRDEYSRRFLTLFAEENVRPRQGGSGCVERVFNARGEVYALKRLTLPERPAASDDGVYERVLEGQRCAFRKEYECQQRLSGFKGFPKLYGYGSIEGVPIILMEWIEGVTLKEARGALSLDPQTRKASPFLVAQLGMELFGLLARMDYLEESFVHRDISPNNIMFRTSQRSLDEQLQTGEFDLCLIDFGSSSSIAEMGASFTVDHSLLRKATPEYAPPEMLTNDLPDLDARRKSPRIDVYALGSVLYELVAGHTPYRLSEQRVVQSYYRYKLEHAIPYAASIHEQLNGQAPIWEPEVRQAYQTCMEEDGAQFSAQRFLESIAVVDAQLNAILQKCLVDDQDARPDAVDVQDMLATFYAQYVNNITRRYRGDELLPFSDGKTGRRQHQVMAPAPLPSTVLRPASPQTPAPVYVVQTTVDRTPATGSCGAFLALGLVLSLLVAGVAGFLLQGTLFSLTSFGLHMVGSVSGVAIAALTAAPVLGALLMRIVSFSPSGKFLSGCVTLALLDAAVIAVACIVAWDSAFATCALGLALILESAIMMIAFLVVYHGSNRV